MTPTLIQHGGPLFRDFICEINKRKSARSYLEIGVRDGSTLNMSECDAIGVDPNFVFRDFQMQRRRELHLYQMTSDVFFRDHDARQILRKPIDVIFLDGLHLFEYLLRDFINSEAIAHPNSLIILDDCLPVNLEMTERVHKPEARMDQSIAGWWTGDVWKMLPVLKKYRPDLRVTPVDTAPTGSVCVTNLDPASSILRSKYHAILDEFVSRKLENLEAFRAAYPTVSGHTILHASDASFYVGP